MHFCDVVGWCCWDVVCDIVDTVAVRSLLAAYVQDQVFYYSCLFAPFLCQDKARSGNRGTVVGGWK